MNEGHTVSVVTAIAKTWPANGRHEIQKGQQRTALISPFLGCSSMFQLLIVEASSAHIRPIQRWRSERQVSVLPFSQSDKFGTNARARKDIELA